MNKLRLLIIAIIGITAVSSIVEAGCLSLYVNNPNGEPSSGAQVRINGPTKFFGNTSFGYLRISNMPGGTYAIEACTYDRISGKKEYSGTATVTIPPKFNICQTATIDMTEVWNP